MAETLNLTWHFNVTGKPDVTGHSGDGNEPTPVTLSLTNGTPTYTEKIIADSYGVDILWTVGEGGRDTFQLAIIVSDKAVFVGRRNDAGTDEFAVDHLHPNIPFIFNDDLYANTTDVLDGAVLVDGTDFNQIDRIEVQRDVADGVGDAKVRLWMWE